MLDLAIRAAREAGALLRDYAARGFQITNKGRIDLVTEADLASEQHLTRLIASHYPEHYILAEESGIGPGRDAKSEYRWIIDPLDGTTNFSHGFPCYAVSIGLERRGEMILGVVYDPTRDELFAAERGAGATLNGQRIQVSEIDQLERALLVSGFPYDVRERMDTYLPAWRKFLECAQGVRRLGSAAIDMCAVAAGRMDGFWEHGLHPWDTAAGWVIVEEAGGRVTQLDGSPFDNFKPSLLCTNGQVHEAMLAVLEEAHRDLKA
ncbi:MAG TPA: inositol monophosphatase family protein [Blastocatellia bacterium]|nr:inositol monophosphatase family protein [Blastocatellia bacterium]